MDSISRYAKAYAIQYSEWSAILWQLRSGAYGERVNLGNAPSMATLALDLAYHRFDDAISEARRNPDRTLGQMLVRAHAADARRID